MSGGIIEERVEVPAGGARLPAVLAYPEAGRPATGMVVAGPHPFLGGQLENNVVAALARAGAGCGWLTLRFAYRSAGGGDLAAQLDRFWATGHAPRDGDLVHDLRAAVDFARSLRPVACLAGYSFGCWLVSRLVAEDGFDGAAVLAAPTVEQHDFSGMASRGGPTLVIGSRNDFATTADSLAEQVGSWRPPAELELFDDAEHFFRGREDDLAGLVAGWLQRLPQRLRAERGEG